MSETSNISYRVQSASPDEILKHLQECDASFVPPLSSRVDLSAYVLKLHQKGIVFEAWDGRVLAGVIAAYFNDAEKRTFISNVSVMQYYKQHGIASVLLEHCIALARERGYSEIRLEVNKDAVPAVRFYTKHGFDQTDIKQDVWTMVYHLHS